MPLAPFCRYKSRMKKLPFKAVAGLTVLAVASALYLYAPAPVLPAQGATRAEFAELSPQRYLKDVTYLASDALKGRGNGTPELDMAVVFTGGNHRQGGIWGRWKNDFIEGAVLSGAK